MRSICQLSRRWHQQFCGSANFAGHQRCLQHLQPVRYYRQTIRDRKTSQPKLPSRSDDLVVREYEQVQGDAHSRVAFNPKADIQNEGRAVQSKLAKLDRELAVLREGPFGPNSEFMRSLPANDRDRVLKALEEEGVLDHEEEDLVDTDELDEMLEDVHAGVSEPDTNAVRGVTLRIPSRQKVYIKHFNKTLANAVKSVSSDPQPHLMLWKWYLRCQQNVVGFSSIIPEDVWQMIWTSQTTAYHRPKYVVMLSKDMLSAEVRLTNTQWVTYIKALKEGGDAATALSTWEGQRSVLGSDDVAASTFWTLGVQLYADLGRPRKAQDVAFECLEHSSLLGPEILLPVISAWAKSSTALSTEKAWTCYLKLRALFQDRMTPEIYESVSSRFLNAKKPDLALAVFKDLMIAEEKSPDDSTALYQNALDLVKDLQCKAVSEEQVNRISLTALIIFPRRFKNKYFFGAWIKQLIGRGDVDGAATVVELMTERGVPLDAKHLNGIIGAWLRQGSPTARLKAERMAWAMINARIDVVKYRLKRSQQHPKSAAETEGAHPPWAGSLRIPRFLRRASPPANIETFSVLLQYYTRRSGTGSINAENAEYVTTMMMGPAQMTPNSFIMNHWLYASLRSSDVQAVWEKYSRLTAKAWNKYYDSQTSVEPEAEFIGQPGLNITSPREPDMNIQPDLETFAALWDTAKIHNDPSRAARSKAFPSARLLYAEMNDWMNNLPEKKAVIAKDEFSKDLHSQILHCFTLSSDLPGTLCALHGLRNIFGEFPNDDTTRTVMILAARLLKAEAPSNKLKGKTLRRKIPPQKTALNLVAGIIEKIDEQQSFKLVQNEIDPTGLDPNSTEAKQLRLDILTEFLLSIMERTKKVGGNVQNEVETVAKVMGVDVRAVNFQCVKGHVMGGRRPIEVWHSE